MRKYSSFIAPHGINLRSDGWISPETLSGVLILTVRFLQAIEPQGTLLRKYADWWEHDGLHFDDGEINFSGLLCMVRTAADVKAAMSHEFLVFVGVAPQDFRWYLRFYYDWDHTGRKEMGRFDLTLPGDLIASFREQIIAPLSIKVEEQEALSYYLSIGMDSYT